MGLGSVRRFALQDFESVFTVKDTHGKPYVLIGGQAVNYWAERYESIEPELQSLRPFTSLDIDFHGFRDDVKHISSSGMVSNFLRAARRIFFPMPPLSTTICWTCPFRRSAKKSR